MNDAIRGYRVSGTDSTPKSWRVLDPHRLNSEQAEALADLHLATKDQGANCIGRESEFTDFNHPRDVPSQAHARILCHDCPVFDICERFDDVANPPFGVWAGRFRGEELI